MLGRRMLADMAQLRADFIRLTELVEEAVAGAIQAVLDRDSIRALEIIAGDDAVDELDNRIGDLCHRVLALYQPVACDLRQVIAVLHMTADLERVGDLAVEIARRTRSLSELSPFPTPEVLPDLAKLAAGMVHRALNAYAERDAALARRVCQARAEVAALNAVVSEELVAAMKSDPAAIEPALCLCAVVRSLQRIADHATNLAEDAVFLLEGHPIRHHREDISLNQVV